MTALNGMPRALRTSFLWGLAVFAYDAANGSCLFSMLACPLWALISLVRSTCRQSGWGVALSRAAIPVAVLTIAVVNDSFQRRVATERAEQVVYAIRAFREKHGRYPKDLQQLVPKHLPLVPRAKYAIAYSGFYYSGGGGESRPGLWWIDIPPHGKLYYNFDKARWSFID